MRKPKTRLITIIQSFARSADENMKTNILKTQTLKYKFAFFLSGQNAEKQMRPPATSHRPLNSPHHPTPSLTPPQRQ